MDDKIEDIIANTRIFGALNSKDIKALAELGEKRHWNKGQQIINEGDKGDSLYLMLSGKVKVVLYGEEGKEIVLSVMKSGDVFGEMSLFDGEPRSANVETVEDTECFIIRGSALVDYMKNHPSIAFSFLSHLSRRLREADRKIGGLALLDVYGIVAIERLTHEDLAAMIGSSREVVSRALKKMTQEGYVETEKDKFILHI